MSFDLEHYLSSGIERLFKDALKVTFKNPKQSAFLLRFAPAVQKAAKRRHDFEKAGLHIPPFLIASITDNCNLNCTGCYSHAHNNCKDSQDFPTSEWARIFDEAVDLGISFILLAGGEPMLRSDVIEAAAQRKSILFPMFTNGTMLDRAALSLFNKHRNLIPIVSIEGDEAATDFRRGQGVFKQAMEAMRCLQDKGLLFGVSVTVTANNLDAVTDNAFIDKLEQSGCKVVLFVEYVPVEQPDIALSSGGRAGLAARINELRASHEGMIIFSFPGDEAEAGGCLAAGRGFFHISASGNAEPCPFSPYSDMNLRNTPLKEALSSPLFSRLREDGILAVKHTGGCVLFEQEETVARLAAKG